MLLQYTGNAGTRVIGAFQWDRANHYIADVTDAKLAADLLTTGEFQPVKGKITAKEVKEVADALGTAPEQVETFVSRPPKPGR